MSDAPVPIGTGDSLPAGTTLEDRINLLEAKVAMLTANSMQGPSFMASANQPNGFLLLDGTGRIPVALLPAIQS